MTKEQDFFRELLALAEAQNRALAGGRLEEALAILGRRQELVSAAQKFDGFPPPEEIRVSRAAQAAVRRILDKDAESRSAVLCLMSDAAARLESVRRMRALCRDLAPADATPVFSGKA